MTYRKNQIADEVEAFQMTKARCCDRHEWPKWLVGALLKPVTTCGSVFVTPDCEHEDASNEMRVFVQVEGSTARVEWGDWIVNEIGVGLSLCSDCDFDALYRDVQDGVVQGYAGQDNDGQEYVFNGHTYRVNDVLL